MLENPPRAQQVPWSINGTSNGASQVSTSGAALPSFPSVSPPASSNGLVNAHVDAGAKIGGRPAEVTRGRIPSARHQQRSIGLEKVPSNGADDLVNGSEQEWRKSLAAESDPIHKESGRSTSRHRTSRSAAVPIQVRNGPQRSTSVYAGAEHASFGDSSPSSVSSYPHTTTTTTNTTTIGTSQSPIKGGSSLNNDPRDELTSSTNTEPLEQTRRMSRSLLNDPGLSARRSLSSTGTGGDRENVRPPTVQRALSINIGTIGIQSANQQSFSPGSLRSTSPESAALSSSAHLAAAGNNNHASPRHGLGRLPEGEEASTDSGTFFPTHQNAFAAPSSLHSFTGPRHRSTSSAAALQGLAERDGTYGGRPVYGSANRSASVWSNAPLSADVAGSSPGSLSFMQNPASAGPISFSRFTSDSVQSPSERGRTFESGYMRHGEMISNKQPVVPSSMHADTFGHLGDDVVKTGSESRRHSLASGVAPMAGQRRAIGFEVTRPASGSRTSSIGRFAGLHSGIAAGNGNRNRSGTGYGLFGGGSLAFSDDDLASDFDALRVDLDQVTLQRQRGETISNVRAHRAANDASSLVGGQAASMPLGFTGFGASPMEKKFEEWPISARLRDDENGSLWSGDSIPSPSGGVHHRREEGNQGAGLSALAQSFQSGNMPMQSGLPSLPQQSGLPSGNTTGGVSSAFKPFGISAKPSLSDHAIASLVTLGPLAPPSGGPTPHDGGGANLQDLGKGVPLQMLPRDTRLYIVEFKQGRTDLYFRQSQAGTNDSNDVLSKGDLVIVEADRGKDLGSVINDSITVDQVQTFLAHQAELAQLSAAGARPDGVHPAAMTLNRLTRSVNPKRLFAKAGPADTSLLHAKAQDEERALTLCSTKVNQRGLPMTVVAAEMQWDRRKLTFYYTATQRVDFRDLVKELFRLYKTRIWMCHLSHPSNAAGATNAGPASSGTGGGGGVVPAQGNAASGADANGAKYSGY